MRPLPIIALFITLSSCCMPDVPKPIKFDEEPYIVHPRQYVIHKASGNIIVDGHAYELDWSQTTFTEPFTDIQSLDKPSLATQVKMLWDKDFLYIYAELEEHHVSASLKQRDTVIFYDNDFEVFLDPQGNTFNYYEIEINAFGTVWDLKLDRPYSRLGKAETHFDIPGLQSAVAVDGSINDARDTDQGWNVEMAIPLHSLVNPMKEQFPSDGVQWRLNFSRVEWQQEYIDGQYKPMMVESKRLPEQNWVWSRQGAVNMHLPENWGYVQFSSSAPEGKAAFKMPDDWLSRQVLFALMRETNLGELKYLMDLSPLSERDFVPFELYGQSFEASFIRAYTGYEIRLRNLNLGKDYVINPMGAITEFP